MKIENGLFICNERELRKLLIKSYNEGFKVSGEGYNNDYGSPFRNRSVYRKIYAKFRSRHINIISPFRKTK